MMQREAAMAMVDTVDVSLVHLRFGADLLDGARDGLLRAADQLDFYMEFANRRMDDAAWTAIAAAAPANRAQLIAAATYALWIADQIRSQVARWERTIASVRAGYTSDPDQVALLDRERPPDGAVPSKHPPPRPGALDGTIALLPPPYRAGLDRAREWVGQALWAARMCNTKSMSAVCGHIEMLLRWTEESNE
jgi:hypothetical protein